MRGAYAAGRRGDFPGGCYTALTASPGRRLNGDSLVAVAYTIDDPAGAEELSLERLCPHATVGHISPGFPLRELLDSSPGGLRTAIANRCTPPARHFARSASIPNTRPNTCGAVRPAPMHGKYTPRSYAGRVIACTGQPLPGGATMVAPRKGE